jgi:type VI secretion system protein ImpA
MAALDLHDLLEPVSPGSPVGDDLSDSFEFAAIARRVEDRAAGAPSNGQAAEADAAHWNDVAGQCAKLLRTSKDVWLVIYLCLAQTKLHKFGGLRGGLDLLDGLLDKYWDSLYPHRDPEDDYPIQRVNAIEELNSPSFLGAVRALTVVQPFHVRDLLVARGEKGFEDKERVDPAAIRGAFLDFRNKKPTEAQEFSDSVRGSIDALDRITERVAEKVEFKRKPDLSDLRRALTVVLEFVDPGLAPPPTEGADPDGAKRPPVPDEDEMIRNRDDVVRVIDKICDFYRSNDPASPVPLMLGRVKRLVPMDFLQVINDLVPDAARDVKRLAGLPEEG